MPRLKRSALLEVPASTAYNVVNAVEQYPEFLPACESVQILEQDDQHVVASVEVSGMGLSESFVTCNTSVADVSIQMSLQSGPFSRLEGSWRFTPLGEVGCRIDLTLDYEPKGMLAMMLSKMVEPVADKLVDTFCQRIEKVHQQTSAPPSP